MKTIHDIVEYLEGTANTLDQALEHYEGNQTREDLEDELSEYIFSCDRCGWWASVDELNNDEDEEICLDCHE